MVLESSRLLMNSEITIVVQDNIICVQNGQTNNSAEHCLSE